jgi:hypothetical protein
MAPAAAVFRPTWTPEGAIAAVQPTKLFIGGISKQTTTKKLRDHFSQYGQVLDCVAMSDKDGVSRGFGLVTMASLASANLCLSEPMIIEGRVLDMKMAVPDKAPRGAHGDGKTARRAAQWWNNDVAPKQAPTQAAVHAPVELSANAPAFIPSSVSFAPQANLPKALPIRVPEVPCEDVLVFAEDYVCFLEDQQQVKGVKKDAKVAPRMQSDEKTVRLPLMELSNTKENDALPFTPLDEPHKQIAIEICAEACEETGDLSDTTVDSSSEEFPSAGSALHCAGECRPCNFHRRGKCASGRDCGFCHLEHDKIQVKRQGKRERQAALKRQLLSETGASGLEVDDQCEVCDPMAITSLLTQMPTQISNQKKTVAGPPGLADPFAELPAAKPFALNFDDFFDDSESEDDLSEPENLTRLEADDSLPVGCQVSRTDMLRMRVEMQSAEAANATAGENVIHCMPSLSERR